MRFRPMIAILSILVVLAVGVALVAVRRSGPGTVAIKSSTASARLTKLQASRNAIARIPGSPG
ncbi:MAG: hypothetical protein JWN32_1185, partial [Solirubrobacterales bacterium]|nr:hypothetical protein [Solirubrobacterales bacterium]